MARMPQMMVRMPKSLGILLNPLFVLHMLCYMMTKDVKSRQKSKRINMNNESDLLVN